MQYRGPWNFQVGVISHMTMKPQLTAKMSSQQQLEKRTLAVVIMTHEDVRMYVGVVNRIPAARSC